MKSPRDLSSTTMCCVASTFKVGNQNLANIKISSYHILLPMNLSTKEPSNLLSRRICQEYIIIDDHNDMLIPCRLSLSFQSDAQSLINGTKG